MYLVFAVFRFFSSFIVPFDLIKSWIVHLFNRILAVHTLHGIVNRKIIARWSFIHCGKSSKTCFVSETVTASDDEGKWASPRGDISAKFSCVDNAMPVQSMQTEKSCIQQKFRLGKIVGNYPPECRTLMSCYALHAELYISKLKLFCRASFREKASGLPECSRPAQNEQILSYIE